MTHRYLSLLVFLLAFSMPAYSDDVVFSNLGPGNSFSNISTVFSGAGSGFGQSVLAVGFTPSGNFTLTQIGVGLTYAFGGNSAILSLDSSSGGLPDGTIESWTVSGLPVFPNTTILQTVMPVSTVSLVSGTQYWIVVGPGANSTNAGWNRSLIDFTSPRAGSFNGGSSFVPASFPPGALEVLGNPVGNEVPEPTSLVLVTIGIVGIEMALRRQVRHPVK